MEVLLVQISREKKSEIRYLGKIKTQKRDYWIFYEIRVDESLNQIIFHIT